MTVKLSAALHPQCPAHPTVWSHLKSTVCSLIACMHAALNNELLFALAMMHGAMAWGVSKCHIGTVGPITLCHSLAASNSCSLSPVHTEWVINASNQTNVKDSEHSHRTRLIMLCIVALKSNLFDFWHVAMQCAMWCHAFGVNGALGFQVNSTNVVFTHYPTLFGPQYKGCLFTADKLHIVTTVPIVAVYDGRHSGQTIGRNTSEVEHRNRTSDFFMSKNRNIRHRPLHPNQPNSSRCIHNCCRWFVVRHCCWSC